MAGSDLSTTLNVSGQPGPSPRENNSYQRHSLFAKRRHDVVSGQFGAFLSSIATKLTSTSAIIFAKVTKYGVDRVKAASNISQLP